MIRKGLAIGIVLLVLVSLMPLINGESDVRNHECSNSFQEDNFQDINDDGIAEKIIFSGDNEASVWNIDGTPSISPQLGVKSRFNTNPLSNLNSFSEPGVPEPQPGWPISTGGPIFSSPVVENLTGDSNPEIVIGSYDNNIYILDAYGVLLPNWPQSTGGDIISSPVVGDVDGDNELEIIVGSWDHKVYAWNVDGTVVTGNWPRVTAGVIEASPVLGDIDGDGELEVIVACDTGTFYVMNGDGSDVDGWPVSFSESIHCSAAIGDIDYDEKLEVIIGTSGWAIGLIYVFNGEDASAANGWPVDVYGWIQSSPAVGDIDNDGDLEIVVGDSWWGGHVWVFDDNGSVVSGWPKDVKNNVVASPALADFDDDSDLEIVVSTSAYVGSPVPAQMFIWHDNGEIVENWPVSFTDPYQRIDSSPCICDINDDNKLDIVMGSADGGTSPSPNLYAYNYNASMVNNAWPLYGEDIYSSPAAGDIDSDGMLEIVVGSWDFKLYCWELGENTYNSALMPWPMYHHDPWHTGLYLESQAPNKPVKPSGELRGNIGVEYTYTTRTTDLNTDKVYYLFDWGDGTNSSWVGPYLSGAIGSAHHVWTKKGLYTVKVKAKDPGGLESAWSNPFPIRMPRIISVNTFVPRLLEIFSHAFPILRYFFNH